MKENVPLGIVIATRELEFVCENGRKDAALVTIGKPVESDEPECWYCPYLIEVGAIKTEHYSVGIDAVQALDLALGVISSELLSLSRRQKGSFLFLGEPGHEFR